MKHRFLPGVYVPPGGKVDEHDVSAKVGVFGSRRYAPSHSLVNYVIEK